jgi:hypothetical protein
MLAVEFFRFAQVMAGVCVNAYVTWIWETPREYTRPIGISLACSCLEMTLCVDTSGIDVVRRVVFGGLVWKRVRATPSEFNQTGVGYLEILHPRLA